MIVIFDKEYLKDLYSNGKCADKKHRFQPEIVSRYIRCINLLIASSAKEDLYKINSLHFEALSGDMEGIYSIRVNLQYRIEFTITENEGQQTITICNILELSNHYK